MKLFIKCSKPNGFQKAKIEITKVGHLTAIQSAIYNDIKRYKEHGWDKDPEMKCYYQQMLEVSKALNNTIDW